MTSATLVDNAAANKMHPWSKIPPVGPMLRPAEAASYYGVSIATYYVLIHDGAVPGFVKLGSRARASAVPRAWLDAAIAARCAVTG